MEITLPLAQMSTAEKLHVMEQLWTDLTTNEEAFESPAWHGQVLSERDQQLKSGQDHYVDWEVAKRELRKLQS